MTPRSWNTLEMSRADSAYKMRQMMLIKKPYSKVGRALFFRIRFGCNHRILRKNKAKL